ncbi:nucleotidyltransferase [Georgenia yuyongxinii]|uniref:nucleotidyltransferase n=1 Tax=Georgenia yuyongxinii TaxID=2589797 RepID=UPI0015D1C4E2|nr:nucleotidyltransferase [Georgenia yuyongxinii]
MDKDERALLRDGLRIAGSALSAADIPFALAGGYAAWVHGAPESDHDVDFAILEKDVDRAKEALGSTALEVEQPVENWLFKAYNEGALVDVIFKVSGDHVTPELLERAERFDVLGVNMPVLPATDVVASKLGVLTEHRCDYSTLLPVVRALREQVDWLEVARQNLDNPYAEAFLFLLGRLGIIHGAAQMPDVGGRESDPPPVPVIPVVEAE